MISHSTSFKLTLVATILLSACATTTPGDSSGNSSSVPDHGKEGGLCGGIAGFQCDEGLTCLYDGTYPDAGGVCIKQ